MARRLGIALGIAAAGLCLAAMTGCGSDDDDNDNDSTGGTGGTGGTGFGGTGGYGGTGWLWRAPVALPVVRLVQLVVRAGSTGGSGGGSAGSTAGSAGSTAGSAGSTAGSAGSAGGDNDNSCADATDLSTSFEGSGEINPPDEADYFSAPLTEGAWVIVRATTTVPSGQTTDDFDYEGRSGHSCNHLRRGRQ